MLAVVAEPEVPIAGNRLIHIEPVLRRIVQVARPAVEELARRIVPVAAPAPEVDITGERPIPAIRPRGWKIKRRNWYHDRRTRRFRIKPTPNASYVCNKCNNGGHWRYLCPADRDSSVTNDEGRCGSTKNIPRRYGPNGPQF